VPSMTHGQADAHAPSLLDLLPIALGLREVLARDGEVTIRTADLRPGRYGETHFVDRLISLATDLPDGEWRPTLVHELLHLIRGPVRLRDADTEETEVERITQDVERLLVAARTRGDYMRPYQREWLRERRELWFKTNGPCVQCGSWESLELDHVDPDEKVHHAIWSWSEARRTAELDKCQALCCDCHRAKTIAAEHAKWEGNTTACLGPRASVSTYRRGCRCAGCCRAKSEDQAAYRARTKSRQQDASQR
jgi:hypothetical protein